MSTGAQSDPDGFVFAEFTETMSRFTTGVTVVTVNDELDDIGSTVTAFSSVSAEPPMVMVCVSRTSYLCEVIDAQGRFAVNVLGDQQRAIAGRFAAEGRPSARLLVARKPHHRGEHTGALILDDSIAALECSVVRCVPAGDHNVYLAEVTSLPHVRRLPAEMSPLIRYGGRYRPLG